MNGVRRELGLQLWDKVGVFFGLLRTASTGALKGSGTGLFFFCIMRAHVAVAAEVLLLQLLGRACITNKDDVRLLRRSNDGNTPQKNWGRVIRIFEKSVFSHTSIFQYRDYIMRRL